MILVSTQANARIHLAATVIVVAAGFICGLSRVEWCAIVGVVTLVWVTEGVNSAIEALVDLVSPGHHPLAGRAKDLAAGAVLCAAVAAVAVGLIVFGPRVLRLVGAVS